MGNAIRVFSGRTFSPEDIVMIKWVQKRYNQLSRTELAGIACEILDWTMPSGQAKVQQCMALFDLLETEEIIQLPSLQISKRRKTMFTYLCMSLIRKKKTRI